MRQREGESGGERGRERERKRECARERESEREREKEIERCFRLQLCLMITSAALTIRVLGVPQRRLIHSCFWAYELIPHSVLIKVISPTNLSTCCLLTILVIKSSRRVGGGVDSGETI